MNTIYDGNYRSDSASTNSNNGRLSYIAAIAGIVLIAGGAIFIFILQHEIDDLKAFNQIMPVTTESTNLETAENRIKRLLEHLHALQKRRTEALTRSNMPVGITDPLLLSAKISQLRQQVESERFVEAADNAFAPLLKSLSLDPKKTAQFKALLTDEHFAAMDAIQAAKAEGIQNPQDYISAVKEAVAQSDQQIQSLLGSDDYEQFTNYEQTLPEQGTVSRLAERLSGTDTPLTDEQQAQLVQLVNQMEAPKFQQNEAFLGMIGLNAAPLTSSMVSASAQILTAPQTAALQAMEQTQKIRAQVASSLLQSAK